MFARQRGQTSSPDLFNLEEGEKDKSEKYRPRNEFRTFTIRFILLGFLALLMWIVIPLKKTTSDVKPDIKVPVEAVREHDEILSKHESSSTLNPNSNNDDPWESYSEDVRKHFLIAHQSYCQYASGYDHLAPLSQTGTDWFGLQLTLMDSLDTLYLMGYDEEVAKAREKISTIEWNKPHTLGHKIVDSNVFEMTIRILGVLLSMIAQTGDDFYLKRAESFAHVLLPAFDTSSGIPLSSIDLPSGMPKASDGGGLASTSEAGTMSLEFRYLAHITRNETYKNLVDRVTLTLIEKSQRFEYLVPIYISPTFGDFSGVHFTLGARGDSYYEYLLKQYIQTRGRLSKIRDAYNQFVRSLRQYLVMKSPMNQYTYIAERLQGLNGPANHKMDHLVCFLPGLLALGATMGRPLDAHSDYNQEDWQLADSLLDTCVRMYTLHSTGLAPEIVYFRHQNHTENDDMYTNAADRFSLLRPETIESLWIMYRLSGHEKYRKDAVKIWTALRTFAYLPKYKAFATVENVAVSESVAHRDHMDSFFMAETMKYLWMVMLPRERVEGRTEVWLQRYWKINDLTQWTFNTEAHPLPVFDPWWSDV